MKGSKQVKAEALAGGVQVSAGTKTMVLITFFIAITAVSLCVVNILILRSLNAFIVELSLNLSILVFGVMCIRHLQDRLPAQNSILISRRAFFLSKILLGVSFFMWLVAQTVALLDVLGLASNGGLIRGFSALGLWLYVFMFVLAAIFSIWVYFGQFSKRF